MVGLQESFIMIVLSLLFPVRKVTTDPILGIPPALLGLI